MFLPLTVCLYRGCVPFPHSVPVAMAVFLSPTVCLYRGCVPFPHSVPVPWLCSLAVCLYRGCVPFPHSVPVAMAVFLSLAVCLWRWCTASCWSFSRRLEWIVELDSWTRRLSLTRPSSLCNSTTDGNTGNSHLARTRKISDWFSCSLQYISILTKTIIYIMQILTTRV